MGKHREGEDIHQRLQKATHEPDTLERLLGEWTETNNDEILQEVHRRRAEDDENERNVGEEDGDKITTKSRHCRHRNKPHPAK